MKSHINKLQAKNSGGFEIITNPANIGVILLPAMAIVEKLSGYPLHNECKVSLEMPDPANGVSTLLKTHVVYGCHRSSFWEHANADEWMADMEYVLNSKETNFVFLESESANKSGHRVAVNLCNVSEIHTHPDKPNKLYFEFKDGYRKTFHASDLEDFQKDVEEISFQTQRSPFQFEPVVHAGAKTDVVTPALAETK